MKYQTKKGKYQIVKEEKKEIYEYKIKCPNCGFENVYYSKTQVSQFLTVCKCQTEFNCFCVENMNIEQFLGVEL